MFDPRVRGVLGGVIACLLIFVMTFALSRTATAGTPGQRSHVSVSGDPDSPTGELGDPDNPMGKKNGSSPLILAIERTSRMQVRIHVAFLGDPDGPYGDQALGHGLTHGWQLNAYDVTGRLRHQWDVQSALAQGGNVIWNMNEDHLPAGIFFVRFQSKTASVTQRVLALH